LTGGIGAYEHNHLGNLQCNEHHTAHASQDAKNLITHLQPEAYGLIKNWTVFRRSLTPVGLYDDVKGLFFWPTLYMVQNINVQNTVTGKQNVNQ